VRRQLNAWSRHAHTLRAFLPHSGMVRAIAISNDGKMILTGAGDDRYRDAILWDAATGKGIGSLPLPSSQYYVAAVAFSPDGKTCVTGGLEIGNEDVRRGSAQLWDVAKREQIGKDLQHDMPIEAVAFSPDGKMVATAGQDRWVRFWDATTGSQTGQPFQL